jgi:HEAT repeat protein
VEQNLQRLRDRDERVRADAAVQLGRLRAERAVDPLAATLAGDSSPVVREAAARGLGLIGSVKGLAALRRAAQVDGDRDVRHSAMFAVDVIQAR